MENLSKIVCLVGESGSGKSTVAEALEEEGLKLINSYTTRKERYLGEKGHIFVNKELYKLDKESGIIAAETYFNNHYYWTTKDQLKENCCYVIDTKGVEYLKKNIKDAEIIVIYLKCSKQNRYIRMMSRDKDKDKVLERIEHDLRAFNDVKADFIVNADKPLESVLNEICDILGLR